MDTKKKKRQVHITGIRGIAIIGIILFHIFKETFPNGYLGVNIFISITGYFLFSALLKEDYLFNLSDFLKNRLTRLYPPYIISICATLFLCAIFLPFDYFQKTAKFAIFSLLSISNIYYHSNFGDYFADSSDSVIFLTSWYFSVLVQIYIFYIILAKTCLLVPMRWRKFVLILIGVISFLSFFPISKWSSITYDDAIVTRSYFSSFSRLWIAIAAAFAANLPEITSTLAKKVIPSLSFIGIFLLLFILPRISPLQDIAIVPISILCIRYAPLGMSECVYKNIFIRRIGEISFSLYLVHWPLLVLGCYFCGRYTSLMDLALIISLIIISSAFLHYFVENKRFSIPFICTTWCTTLAAALCIYCSDGMKNFLHPTILALGDPSYKNYTPIPNDSALSANFPLHMIWKNTNSWGGVISPLESPKALYHLGSEHKKPNFILLGDSHALAIMPGFDVIGKQMGWSGVYAQTYIMPFTQYQGSAANQSWTKKRFLALKSYLRAHPELHTVVLVQFWSARMKKPYFSWDGESINPSRTPEKIFENARDFVLHMKEINKNVIILTDVPAFKNIPIKKQWKTSYDYLDVAAYARQSTINDGKPDLSLMSVTLEEYDNDNLLANQFLDAINDAKIAQVIHIEKVLYKNNIFTIMKNGKLLYKDIHHLSPYGAIEVVKGIREEFSQKLLEEGAPY